MCDGPTDGNSFTFIFEGDFTHGYADYYDIQRYLTALGRRSCIYDKPGLGYSDYLFSDQKNVSTFYYNFLNGIEEKKPYVLVGWGGGGNIIYNFALEHPELVKSLTFLDVYSPGIEFTSMKYLNNWSTEQMNAYKTQELNGRKSLFGIINGLAVPWGLMSLFLGSSNTSNADEITFWMSTEKTWITQATMFDSIYEDNGSYYKQNLTSSISVNLVVSKHDDNWVIKNAYPCQQKGADSAECKFEIKKNKYYLDSELDFVPTLNGGSTVYCTDDACGLAYYTFINPKYTADTLNSLYSK